MTTKQLLSRNVLMGILHIALILFFATSLHSCTDEQTQTPINHDGETTITFSVNAPQGFNPVTYTLSNGDESQIETIDVLLFETGGGDYVSGPHYGAISGTNVTIRIPESTADYDMVILANCREEINGTSLSGTKENILSALTLTMPASGWITDTSDDSYRAIPMWAETAVSVTGSTATVTYPADKNAIELVRMLARINVTNNASASFTLTSVHLCNYNDAGNIAPTSTTPSPNKTGFSNAILYTSLDENGNCINEIYTFEAATADKYNVDNPCLVIGGSYNGDTNDTYYRIDFVTEDEGEVTYLDLLRNYSYDIEISKVNGLGYGSPEEALASRPINVEYDVADWNDSEVGTIVVPGYSLGISKTDFSFDWEGNGENQFIVKTDYSGDLEAEATETWLDVQLGAPVDANGIKTYQITLGAGVYVVPEIGSRDAFVKLTAGDITYNVKVSQEGDVWDLNVSGLTNYYLLDGNPNTFTITSSTPFEITGMPTDIGTLDYNNSAAPSGTTVTFTSFNETSPNTVRSTELTITNSTYPECFKTFNLTCSNIPVDITPAEQANCYIVHPSNTVKEVAIPVSQAYRALGTTNGGVSEATLPAGWFGSDEFAAELIWKDNSGLTFDISMVWGKNGSDAILYVKPTSDASVFGNAVIGIRKKNAAGQPEGGFLWSWHIWVTDYNPISTGTSDKLLMDRNLGALNNGFSTDPIDASTINNISQDPQTAGLFYQWGRKDPFPGATSISSSSDVEPVLSSSSPSYLDASSKLLKVSTSNITTESTYTNVTGSPQNLCYSIANPHIFYTTNSSPQDWYTSSGVSGNDNLWGNTSKSKTVYDPCPPGWKVPRAGGYTNGKTSPTLSDTSTPKRAEVGWHWHETETVKGYRVYQGDLDPTYKNQYSFSESAFYPAAGGRGLGGGYFENVGSIGGYWLSINGNVDGRRLSFSASSVIPGSNQGRSRGYSVRCVQESSE